MGGQVSCKNEEVQRSRAISREIDRQLHASSTRYIQKLLLLGPGESGKSTCVKQIQILHAQGFTKIELEERRSLVYSNTIRTVVELIEFMPKLGMKYSNPKNNAVGKQIKKYVEAGLEFEVFTPEIRDKLKSLWADIGIRETFNHRNLFQCNDSSLHFLNNLDRISTPNYMPTNEDILHTRIPTTGVVQFNFMCNGIEFSIVDVGGQRSERRKWLHVFDDTNAIIYVCAISEYDQRLREDNKTNRLMESLELFDSVVNTTFFANTSTILFLNKKDLFAEKIRRVSLSMLFKHYRGGMNYCDGISFLRRQFHKLHPNLNKLYTHETCATDTNQVEQVFDSVLDHIVQENLKDTGML
ncbi:Guanine nucleotide binding protein (G-protein) domain containing protein [Aphelenchoides bicaudatus]|nr:Guanine nucleotide binding protein (G-protein) domain containing protein [Aphelenchoides bicaudatus]